MEIERSVSLCAGRLGRVSSLAVSDSCCSPLHQRGVRLPHKDDLRPAGRRSTDDSKVTYASLATPGQPSELAEREVLDNVRLQKLFRNLRHQVCSTESQVHICPVQI